MTYGPVREGLETALQEMRDDGQFFPESNALIAAARAAATKVDEAPPTDNVSLSTYYKYLEALGLLDQKGKPSIKKQLARGELTKMQAMVLENEAAMNK